MVFEKVHCLHGREHIPGKYAICNILQLTKKQTNTMIGTEVDCFNGRKRKTKKTLIS